MKKHPNQTEFLSTCNGKCRERTFNASDYVAFRRAIRCAQCAVKNGKPCYKSDDAGSVATAYKYSATSARWGVWVDPEHTIVLTVFGRIQTCNNHVKCAYDGGERAYKREWSAGADKRKFWQESHAMSAI